MNEREANQQLIFLKNDLVGLKYNSCASRRMEEALNKAIKALEKQIPKKVKKFPSFTIHPYPRFIYIDMCPNCDHVVEQYEDNHIYPRTRNDFCNRCGQKLDWTVEEGETNV